MCIFFLQIYLDNILSLLNTFSVLRDGCHGQIQSVGFLNRDFSLKTHETHYPTKTAFVSMIIRNNFTNLPKINNKAARY